MRILEKALTLELRHFEDPEFYDRLTRARREASSRPLSLVTETFQLVQNVLTLAGYVALLLRFTGWVVLGLMVATIPATIAEMRFCAGLPPAQLALARERGGSTTSSTSSRTTSTPRR